MQPETRGLQVDITLYYGHIIYTHVHVNTLYVFSITYLWIQDIIWAWAVGRRLNESPKMKTALCSRLPRGQCDFTFTCSRVNKSMIYSTTGFHLSNHSVTAQLCSSPLNSTKYFSSISRKKKRKSPLETALCAFLVRTWSCRQWLTTQMTLFTHHEVNQPNDLWIYLLFILVCALSLLRSLCV